jgi:hypothetical protein
MVGPPRPFYFTSYALWNYVALPFSSHNSRSERSAGLVRLSPLLHPASSRDSKTVGDGVSIQIYRSPEATS